MNESARGSARNPELVQLSDKLAEHTQNYINAGGEIEQNPLVTYTVAEIKEKGLLDIENIKVNRKAKRPKG